MICNKVYNKDCMIGLNELDDGLIDSIVTDAPYGIDYSRHNSKNLEIRDERVVNDNMLGDDWIDWFQPICDNAYRVLKDNTASFFFSGYDTVRTTYCMKKSGFEVKANLVWIKNNFTVGYHFRRQCEHILVGFKGNPPRPDVPISDVIFVDKVLGYKLRHPNEKPEELIRFLLSRYTKEGDIVVDMFAGSGTTAVACKQCNRHFIGFEILKKYCDIANDRVSNCSVIHDYI